MSGYVYSFILTQWGFDKVDRKLSNTRGKPTPLSSHVLSRVCLQTPNTTFTSAQCLARCGCQAKGSIDTSETMSVPGMTSDDLPGVNPVKRNKRVSVLKRVISSIKEATTSSASADCATACMRCAGKNLKVGQDGVSIVCPDCQKDA